MIYFVVNRTFDDMKAKNRIRVVLAEKNMYISDLAKHKEIEVSPVTASRWVNNKQQPPLQTLYNIANVLEVNVCDLLEGAGTATHTPTATTIAPTDGVKETFEQKLKKLEMVFMDIVNNDLSKLDENTYNFSRSLEHLIGELKAAKNDIDNPFDPNSINEN